jgi:hypothetical protein
MKIFYDNSIPINDEDIINEKCLEDQLKGGKINFAELKHLYRPCMKDKLKVIENFEGSIFTFDNIATFVIFIIVIYVIIKYLLKK